MDSQSHLKPVEGGYVFAGISYGTQPLTVEARNKRFIVLRAPGYSWNASGIRGMRVVRYSPATIVVCRIINEMDDGSMRVERVIGWEPFEVAKRRKKA